MFSARRSVVITSNPSLMVLHNVAKRLWKIVQQKCLLIGNFRKINFTKYFVKLISRKFYRRPFCQISAHYYVWWCLDFYDNGTAILQLSLQFVKVASKCQVWGKVKPPKSREKIARTWCERMLVVVVCCAFLDQKPNFSAINSGMEKCAALENHQIYAKKRNKSHFLLFFLN